MKFGISKLSAIALRELPSDTSEMTSQLLFGESYEILDQHKNWSFIRTQFDNYKGWISNNQIFEQEPSDFSKGNDQVLISFNGFANVQQNKLLLSFGSSIASEIPDNIAGQKFLYEGETRSASIADASFILPFARLLLNVPYLWGGRTIFGMDCSGFTQIVFKAAGYKLLRDANLQATQGISINFIQEALPGDLIFFDNNEGKIVHTGIFTENKTIIHASGRIKEDFIDHYGIFDREIGHYTHQLRAIKRII